MELNVVKIAAHYYLEHPRTGHYAVLKGKHSLFGWTLNLPDAASFNEAWVAKFYAHAWGHTTNAHIIDTNLSTEGGA